MEELLSNPAMNATGLKGGARRAIFCAGRVIAQALGFA